MREARIGVIQQEVDSGRDLFQHGPLEKNRPEVGELSARSTIHKRCFSPDRGVPRCLRAERRHLIHRRRGFTNCGRGGLRIGP